MKALLPLALGCLLAGCATAGPNNVILTSQSNGKTVTVPVGSTILVRLAANPSTGFDWTPVSVAAPVLTLAGFTYTSSAPTGIVGAGGTDIFRFHADKPGTEVLQLNYARSWETNVPPVSTVSFTVSVRR
jgi:inhibitor of cysteine peptidase